MVLRRQRAPTRIRAIGGAAPALKALKGERTVLESAHPPLPVRRDYSRRLDKFWEFGQRRGLPLANLKLCDDALRDFADLLFLGGEQVDAGAKLLAAPGNYDIQRCGAPSPPRFRRVFRARDRRGPAGGRGPLPIRLLAGVLGALALRGRREEVLAVALMFSCCPGAPELIAMVEGDRLEPVANAGVALSCWSLLLRPFERGGAGRGGPVRRRDASGQPRLPQPGRAPCWLARRRSGGLALQFQPGAAASPLPGSLPRSGPRVAEPRDVLVAPLGFSYEDTRDPGDQAAWPLAQRLRTASLHEGMEGPGASQVLAPEASVWCRSAEANFSAILRGAWQPALQPSGVCRSLSAGHV
ncbi:unnamed protein product [Prorocentrum cordatum]|uniref:Poly(ADP-ribose) glycohydrolase n=1 Tax=Prorocentrum cordatum TaxID=2364126 RepID=A0ABN9VS87_9DINO|nr:unnamed protein product [Polarella glacialis]